MDPDLRFDPHPDRGVNVCRRRGFHHSARPHLPGQHDARATREHRAGPVSGDVLHRVPALRGPHGRSRKVKGYVYRPHRHWPGGVCCIDSR